MSPASSAGSNVRHSAAASFTAGDASQGGAAPTKWASWRIEEQCNTPLANPLCLEQLHSMRSNVG